MRSALAGTASNVVALKTTAAVPMSVIERMYEWPLGLIKNLHNFSATQGGSGGGLLGPTVEAPPCPVSKETALPAQMSSFV
jgi:hypothetical protein